MSPQCLPPAPLTTDPIEALAAGMADEMARRWRAGERPLVEEYLAQRPELSAWPRAAARLIHEEICLRAELDVSGSPSAVTGRFPRWRNELAMLLDCHRLIGAPSALPDYPDLGDHMAGFHLEAELGRGLHGRVFLASQADLAGRLVVLKITPLEGSEHLCLARLQHTGIVPLHGMFEDQKRHVRVLCMPYFAGITWARALEAVRDRPVERRRGADLVAALDGVPEQWAAACPRTGAARRLLAGATYVEAICAVGVWLAEALHYAHERGLVHLDVKPSNVLLAADGQPMLLDFHLAHAPLCSGEPAPLWLGGTPEYMAPEHHLALVAVRAAEPLLDSVDGRADVYSLGLLLYQALGGLMPVAPGAAPALCQHIRGLSVGLSDIIGRCLSSEPAERYPSAASLADDLRRHLEARPLCGVRNRSSRERWRKWRRRRPQALTIIVLAAALTAAALGGFALTGHADLQERERLRLAADEGAALLAAGRYHEAEKTLADVAVQARLVGDREILDRSESSLRTAADRRAALDLHHWVDRLRYACASTAARAGSLPRLDSDWALQWQSALALCRRIALNPARPDAPGTRTPAIGISEDLREQVRHDVLDLAVLAAHPQTRGISAGEARRAWRQALRLLRQAEQVVGGRAIIYRERQYYATLLGLNDAAREAAHRSAEVLPSTSWDCYAIGRSAFLRGDVSGALPWLRRATALAPQDFWAQFYFGVTAYGAHRYQDACEAFQATIALSPDAAACYHNRGRARAALGRNALALEDYDRALQLDPGLPEVRLHRGLLRYQRHEFPQAISELQAAVQTGEEPAVAAYYLALSHLAVHDRASARSVLARLPDDPAVRKLRDRLASEP